MWYKASIVIIFILIKSIFCLDRNVVKFSIDYFIYREIKFVCLLNCESDNYWNYQFAKSASQQLIAVSKVEINVNFINTDDLSSCLNLKHSSLGVVVDANCLGFEEVMNFASSKMMFDSIHKWLLIDDDNKKLNEVIDYQNGTEINFNVENKEIYNISDTLTVIENLNTSVDSDIIIGIRKDFYFDLLEAFNFGKIQGGNLNTQYVGSWNNDTGLLMAKNINTYKYYYRWNFQKWAMRMIVVSTIPPEQFRPEMITGRALAPGVPRITQTCAMVLHAIADIHNFRFIYTIGDRWIGTYDTKNTMVVASSLYFGYQDISPLIRISSYIWGKIDIVHPPLTSLETRYYYRIPTKGPGKFENQFLRPLTTGAWLSVIALTVTCALSLVVAAKLEQRPKPAQYAAFSVIASFCQQFFDDCGDNDTRRVSQARRIAIFVTGLSCVLIYNYYTSSVVSWLLNGPPPSINSLQELLDSPLELIYEDIGYARTWMQTPSYYYNKKNAKVEDEMRRKKVFNKKKDDPLFLPTDEGIEMVKAGGYAYHTQVDTANVLISRKFNQMELCELGSLQSMEKTLLFPAIQKNSPYKEFLVWSVARLSERGVVSCIQRRTTSESVSCEGSSPRALALGGATPAFLLLAFGYLLATFIMFLERFVHKHGGLKKEQCRLRFLGDICSGSITQ